MCILHRTKCGCCLTTIVEWAEACGKIQHYRPNANYLPAEYLCHGYQYPPAFLDEACEKCEREANERMRTQTEAEKTAADEAWDKLATEGPAAEKRRNETEQDRVEREEWEQGIVATEHALRTQEKERREARKKRREERAAAEARERSRIRAERNARRAAKRGE